MYDDTKLRRVVKILQVFRKNKQFLRNAGWCVSSVKSPRWWGGVRNYDEVVITAILVQQSTWTSVEKSLKRLRRAKLSKLEVLGDKKVTMIERLIAPVGLGKQKAERLIGVSRGVSKMGGLDRLRRVENVRDLLTSIRGVGSETADSIALFALNKRTVPISGYVRRVLGRFGIINQEDNYEKLRNLVLKAIGDNLYELKIFYAGVTSVGRTVCKSRPKCDLCPLRDFCSFAYISGLSNPLRPKV